MRDVSLDAALIDLLEPWYCSISDYQQICQTEQQEFEALAGFINAVAENFFFQTMDESSIAQWEQALGIIPNPQTEDLEFRRYRVLNRISTKPPFTLRFLYQKLDSIIGAGNYEISVDYPNYTLYIKSSALNQNYAQEILYTLNTVKPCHIVYVNVPYLKDTVVLNESVYLAELIWNYRLGYWGLGSAPFMTMQNEGEIVMPSQKTVQSAMLSNVAQFLQGDVASARLNGNILISDLNKSVNGNILNVTYSVTPQQVQEVTLIELLDTSGDILTSAGVYVPVTDTTTFSHDIFVKEE